MRLGERQCKKMKLYMDHSFNYIHFVNRFVTVHLLPLTHGKVKGTVHFNTKSKALFRV